MKKSAFRKEKKPNTLSQAMPGLRRIFKEFWPQIRQQKLLLSVSCIGLIVEVVAQLLRPWPLKFIFDYVILHDTGALALEFPMLANSNPMMLLFIFSLAIVGVSGLRAAAAYVSLVTMSLAASRIVAEIRAGLYAHLQRLSLSFYYTVKSGDLITRITSDIDRLRNVTVTGIFPLIVNVLTLVGMVGLMFWLNWELALIGLAVFPLFLLSSVKITKRIHKVSRKQRKQEGAMAATAAEAIGAIKVVQALSLEGMLQGMFATPNRESLADSARTQQLSASLQRTIEILVAIATALVMWRGVRLVLGGSVTPGDLLVFVNYLKSAFKPTRQLAKHVANISKATASGERIIDLLDVVPAIRDTRGAIEAPLFNGDVKFNRVSFAYDSDKPILKNLSFDVKAGQKVALVGPSGGGKSTLVSLLLRLYDPLEGQILIDGRDLRQYKLESLRRQISIVLQDSVLFGVSVRDNIAYGALGATDREIKAAARLANAHDFILALPQGYDTKLSERGSTLSGGQRQRIAIARAAVRKAPIVILDEPTVGLDNKSEQTVTEALDRLTANCTTFLITHDLRTSKNADQICYIENGRVLELGNHSGLMALGKRYAALYQLQSAVDTKCWETCSCIPTELPPQQQRTKN
ncbi:Xenobiotic-transporting ATPase [Hyella patelloides LEGE 07179]|uniref:Xenobiotic-transporting ATPase n=1 Tax=Hyella patelloides LEGE 07179 TaxID=945734 RepID=A0A563VJI1_9CYAN|nr:ABC transporter ATP-binding protein [Hyella patelloides]VEP11477.1 Xenobiotic-transporting ATPase [Hyella patelloides LEGE 07179]